MLIEEFVEIRIDPRTVKHYRELGYDVKGRETTKVLNRHLSRGSRIKIKVKCDYCEDVFERLFKDHIKIEEKEFYNNKHACKSCRDEKLKDVEKEFNEGVPFNLTEEAIRKRDFTNLEKYGNKNPLGNKKVRKKAKNTILNKFGVDNFFKHKDFRSIRKDSMIDKYGYEYYHEVPDKVKVANEKRALTMFGNNTAPCSRQQIYIRNITGGEINYPVSESFLDIAFPEDKVYIEYQGSGHDLSVKAFGKMTQKEFDRREINRYFFIKRLGWKMIEIISKEDLLPKKNVILRMIDESKALFKTRSRVVFDIDKGTIETKDEKCEFEYGELERKWTNIPMDFNNSGIRKL